ncbi:hypothetical protein PWG71_03220 [Nocardiopsis sp. N85]|uniref:hypothetical protein n=1 Tax=Nocardiopsis sp. N85 TaxID=3029400 RepID=UPI00237F0907|nr:hypothetical protein [Nocardiopsis sp. N85]MDE3720383.1 hypothetical protein [Nocardiopsis sp. N85]
MIPFGTRLIGRTEKTLNALLTAVLADSGLSEPQWVALRIAEHFEGPGDLSAHIRDQTHFPDPDSLLADLTERGLISDGRITDTGRGFLGRTGERIAELTDPIWERLSADDTAAAERALNTVLEGTRAVLAALPTAHARPAAGLSSGG